MVYFDKKKRKYFLGNPPIDKNIKIESPPKFVPVPKGATWQPWNELKETQCQFALDGFFDGPSNDFACCGKDTVGGKGLGRRFCEFHKTVAEHGVKNK
jgi:hypothetical protein